LLSFVGLVGWLGPNAMLSAQAAPSFVRVSGTQLILDGQPFRFLGANVSVIHGERERAGYEAVLDAAKADGLRVVRLWALGEQPEPGEPYHPLYAFRIGERGWIDASFEHLDKVLAAARARDLKVILVLANRWKDYGGIATYLRWGGAQVARDARGEPTGGALSAFFACASCQLLYREHVERLITRTNSVTGTPYRDDPTIMAWELINEASAVSARQEEALLDWVRDTARRIRTLDPHHLISAGHIGYQTERERRVWRAVQSLPEIDFADAHVYPEADPRIRSSAQLPALLDDPIALALVAVKKPLVFGEFGFDRSADGARERWTRAFLRHVEARGVSGALIWIYEAPGSPLRRHTISVGPEDTRGLRVRRLLRDAAARAALTLRDHDELPWASAQLPRFAPPYKERGRELPHRRFVRDGDHLVLEIQPSDFARMQFERAGVYVADGNETVWGSGEGEVEYRFRAPPFVPARFAVAARISSELPGADDGADPRDGSDVEVSLDDRVIATVRAKPDDGVGAVVEVELVDARLLARLFRAGRTHRLRLRALPSPFAGGLCVYGRDVHGPAQDAPALLSHVRVTLERAR
jgi:mannan endo-1,4-beta-mannosidase